MKRLDVYLMREMVVPFLIGTVSVVLMFQANTYMALARELELKNVPFSAVIQVLYYKTPFFLSMTLPLGMALAASLAMSRIARESELTAFRAAGARILRVLLPIAVFGAGVSVLHFYVVEKLMPPAEKIAADVQARVWGLGQSPTFASNRTINLGRYAASLGTIQRISDAGDMDISSVMLIEHPDANTIDLTTAQSATYRDGVWKFRNAFYYSLQGENMIVAHPQQDFVINERIPFDDLFRMPVAEEQSVEELRDQIRTARIMGANVHSLQLALDNKYSVPVSCLVFAFVSPIFAIIFARSGGFAGVLLSFVMALLYYNAFVISTLILGKIEVIPAGVASWLPNCLFILLGIIGVRSLE